MALKPCMLALWALVVTLASAEDSELYSHARCVGLNPLQSPLKNPKNADARALDRDWLFHSCLYRNLCYAPRTGDWRLYTENGPQAPPAPGEEAAGLFRNESVTVGIGAINPRWTWKAGSGVWEMRMQPREVAGAVPTASAGFRWAEDVPALQEYLGRARGRNDTTEPLWMIWHSMAAHNFGHMLWDDLMPLFLLQNLFGASMNAADARELREQSPFSKSPTRAVPLRFSFPKEHFVLWATCEFLEIKTADSGCDAILSKWLPGLGHGNGAGDAVAREERQAHGKAMAPPRLAHDIPWEADVELVCFPWAAAGISMLSDHCTKLHGWDDRDYFFDTVCNGARGGAFYAFRNAMVKNLVPDLEAGSAILTMGGVVRHTGVVTSVTVELPPRIRRRIVFVLHSSRDPVRSLGFAEQIEAAKELPGWDVVVLSSPHRLSAAEQVYLAATTSIWVTACGGAAATAMFLPRGASAIIYYGANRSHGFAYLDWDIFAHMSYLSVLWLKSPKLEAGGREAGAQIFREALQKEVRRVEAFVDLA